MSLSQESLFSLELVVEKLYVPYVTCRFPAVAFRLLDFPTILISHVEQDLGDTIRRKINSDPYYHVPNQFADLQDKHGNFMMKKGKSCLFKIAFDTLAMHLENTPLYIMVIDEYPEVPKLLGNSSLAMNEITDAIKLDLKKNGFTVPSVHGDKGLFKIYSLMGKEIGYMILGFRLLSLGPGLIAHLPATAIAKRASDKRGYQEPKSVIEEVIEVKQQQSLSAMNQRPLIQATRKSNLENVIKEKDKLNSTREIGSMTEIERCDALMQTVDMNEENIHIAVSSKQDKKALKTTETQTDKKSKQKKIEDLILKVEESEDEDDGIVINPNIICPPPLFYNSQAKPSVQIKNDVRAEQDNESINDDFTFDDVSGDEQPVQLDKKGKRSDIPATRMIQDIPRIHDPKTVVLTSVKGGQPTHLANLGIDSTTANQPVFPILTALLTELTKIQNPEFVNQALNQVQAATSAQQPVKKSDKDSSVIKKPIKEVKSRSEENLSDIGDQEEKKVNTPSRRKVKKFHRVPASKSEVVPKQKGWIRQQPEAAVKKTKLVFGLTNTQRLRLAKQNPSWLESAEKEEKIAKSQRQKTQKSKDPDHDIDTGNLSDTYTEVRRLAAAELEKSTMAGPLMTETSHKKDKRKRSKSRETSQTKGNVSRTRSYSPAKVKNVRERSKSPRSKKGLKRLPDQDKDSEAEDEVNSLLDHGKADKVESVAESMPSSRIEVHIPSARQDDSDLENTFTDTFEEITPTERKDTQSRFPGFSRGNSGDDTLPEPIAADGSASMNSTTVFDDDSPLESTRVSKQFRPEIPRTDSLFKSTEDYDTKQFHSTDEPELQKLMTDDEKADTLPTPQTDRSAVLQSPSLQTADNNNRLSMKFEVINPKASLQSPLPALRRSQQLKVDSMNARPSPTDTPRSRSSGGSSKQPTPRPRKQLREKRIEFKKESIHTESVSSYQPSESENILSLISDGSYSDDFNMSSDRDASSKLSTPELPKLIPSTKLGFTIH